MGYSKDVYTAAFKELENRRLRAARDLRQRRESFYEYCPRAAEIESELASISVAAGRAVLGGKDLRQELELMRQKSLGLQQELSALLSENHLPPNYLEEWYICPECSDRGHIGGHICSCMKRLLSQLAYERINAGSRLELTDFDSFSVLYYPDVYDEQAGRNIRDYMESVLRFCRRYAEKFSPESGSMLFQGGPGLGKTHLSLAIAQEVIDKGFGVVYVSAPQILRRLEDEQFGRVRDEERGTTEELLRTCDLLILDDLGTEFGSRFSTAAVYDLINSRLLEHKALIISTNLTVKDMEEKYGIRLVSRVVGTLDRVEFLGNDIRQIKRREKNSKK